MLDQIIAKKRQVVAEHKELYPTKLLEKSLYFETPVVSLKEYLAREDKIGIIAEIKRRSPSKGLLHPNISVERLSVAYMQAGASALSVLTEGHFFDGDAEDLRVARKFNFCPILRKDFIIDRYQVTETRAMGADVILLIAHVLSPQQTQELSAFAQELGLEVLLEVHNAAEIDSHLNPHIDIIGVNNRNLDDFSVSLQTSFNLLEKLPSNITRISESGISKASEVKALKDAGYHGVLIGETFMSQSHPGKVCERLIRQVKSL